MIEINSNGFVLQCEMENDGLMISGFSAVDSVLWIPDEADVDGKRTKVTGIRKKAFLGCTGLREVSVSSFIEEIGDWAFSQCIHLSVVEFRGGRLPNLGKNVFEGCERIDRIKAFSDDGLAKLLALVVTALPGAYLLRDGDVGSAEWYKRYDLNLTSFLKQDDYEGYSDRALCGEEDISYDGIGSVDGELLGEDSDYINQVSKTKSRIAYLRLTYKNELSPETETSLRNYIKSHGRGKPMPSAWRLLKEELRDDLEVLKLYLNIVEPDEKEYEALIEDLGDDCAQAKAYLITCTGADQKLEKAFDDLFL